MVGEGGVAGRNARRSQQVLAAALGVIAAMAVVAGVGMHRQASVTELMVPPRLAALRARLQTVEDNLMGETGGQALRTAKQAQSLQLVINNEQAVALRAEAARTPGPATLQTLTSFQPHAKVIRAPVRAVREPEITYSSAVAAGAARGPSPLDTRWNRAKTALTAAQTLAANLARYEHSARKQSGPHTPTVQGNRVHIEVAAHGKPAGNVNPWSLVPKNPIVKGKHPVVHKAVHGAAQRASVRGPRKWARKWARKDGKVLLAEGRRILARSVKAGAKGYVTIHPLLPGQKLPKGAKVLPASAALARHKGVKTQGLTRVMLDEAEGATVDEEGAEGDEGNSTSLPREEVGDTGMTVDELKAFSAAEKAKAKFLLGQAEKERSNAMDELEASRNMIARGWGKHNTADATWADAEKHMANSTMLFSTYQRELATAKAEKEGSLATKMEEIAARFEEDAAKKHAAYEEAMGEAPDLNLEPLDLSPAANNATRTEGEEGEVDEGEAVEAAV